MPSKPMSWKAWIRACVKDEGCPIDLPRVRYPLAPLTGQDTRALDAIVACWQLYFGSDEWGGRAALEAVRALLPALQPSCRRFARELIPYAGDWSHREKLWPLVVDPRPVPAGTFASLFPEDAAGLSNTNGTGGAAPSHGPPPLLRADGDLCDHAGTERTIDRATGVECCSECGADINGAKW